MSGLFGFINFEKKSIEEHIYLKCIENLKHRGGDGIFTKKFDTLVITYFHQNTTYQSLNEEQPIFDEELVIVADARLDNREELFEIFEIEPACDIPDSQLIKLAYLKWGEESFEKLIGDFAIIIYDIIKKKVFLCRDYSGVRPLYYTIKGDELFFSSEVKSFFVIDNFKIKPNKKRIEEYLKIPGLTPFYQKETFYLGINQVLPANYITINLATKKISEKNYWDLNKSIYQNLSDNQLLEEFKNVFKNTIRSRIHSPYNVASIISGGIDSSSVTIVANEIIDKSNQELSTYFFKPNVQNSFEEQKVKDFISQTNLPYFDTEYGKELLLSNDEICEITGAPEKYPIKYNTLKNIFTEIKKNNCRILLTGTDGDTVVGFGNEVFQNALKNNDFSLFFKYLNEKYTLSDLDSKSNYGSNKNQIKSIIVSQILRDTISVFGKFKGILMSIKILSNKNLLKVEYINILLQSKLKNRKEQKLLRRYVNKHEPNNKTGVELYRNGNYFQLSTERQEYLNHIGTHYNIEVSHPILDKRLIEICHFISPEIKFWRGHTRGPIRYITESLLPESYIKTKTKSDNDYLLTLKQETYHDIEGIQKYIDKNKMIINSLSKEYKTPNYNNLNKNLKNIPYYKLNSIIQLVSWFNYIKKYE